MFSQRLKELRKDRGITQEQLAIAIGVERSSVGKYEGKGNIMPSLDILNTIADYFNCSVDYLLGRTNTQVDEKVLDKVNEIDNDILEYKGNIHEAENLQKLRDSGVDIVIPYNPTHRIPILGSISAGLPMYAQENIEGYTYTELNGGDEYFGLRVHGDSMSAARIQEGDVVIVRRQPMVEDGEIAIVLVNGNEATIKRFYHTDTSVTLMPQSTNPEHLPQIYDPSKVDIKIIGKVVEVKIIL